MMGVVVQYACYDETMRCTGGNKGKDSGFWCVAITKNHEDGNLETKNKSTSNIEEKTPSKKVIRKQNKHFISIEVGNL